jgi:Flp pilus assembly pilin Flp
MNDRPRPPSSSRTSRALLADANGSALTEYVVAVGLVGLVVAAGLVARGDMLIRDYANARDLFLVPGL